MNELLSALLILVAMNRTAGAVSVQNNDPCRLLTSNEVETIIGPLAGPPYRANGATPAPRGEDCRYEVASGRSIRVNVTWDGGKQFIGMMDGMENVMKTAGLSELKLSSGATVTGEWDQARVNQCCEFNALKGDRLVTVDVAGSHATIAQAASLADTAIRRLDQPLDVNGVDGIKSAKDRAAQRPRRRNVCELLPQADAEAIVGTTLTAPPKSNQENCAYEWSLDANGSRNSVKLMVQWKDGFHELRQVSAMTGQATSMLGMNKLFGQAPSKPDDGPWDEFAKSIIGVMAVKSDVLVSLESGPFQQDIAQAFVAKAIDNLSK